MSSARTEGGDNGLKKRKVSSTGENATTPEESPLNVLSSLATMASRTVQVATPPISHPPGGPTDSAPNSRPASPAQSDTEWSEAEHHAHPPPPPIPGAPVGGLAASPLMTWKPYCPATWHQMMEANGDPHTLSALAVEVEKGFAYSAIDRAFICQKKNHFQMAVKFNPPRGKCIRLASGDVVPCNDLFLCVHGLKTENPDSVVTIEQSRRPDRTRHPLSPIAIINSASTTAQKLTIPRLHFSETTPNNMRKKGKPNPNQRYFSLVITLVATVDGRSYPLLAMESERIIVRAANLNIFVENESPQQWIPATKHNSIAFFGQVGINTDAPREALTVHGNVQVTGAVLQPSDKRLKEQIVGLDSKQQLANIRRIALYRYELKDAWARLAGRAQTKGEVGVLAQDLQQVMPDAVWVTEQDVALGDGEVASNLLLVNKERLFMENVGAVQELAKLHAELEQRIKGLEILGGDSLNSPAAGESTFRMNNSSGGRALLWGDGRLHTMMAFTLGMVTMLCLLLMAVLAQGDGCYMMMTNVNNSGSGYNLE